MPANAAPAVRIAFGTLAPPANASNPASTAMSVAIKRINNVHTQAHAGPVWTAALKRTAVPDDMDLHPHDLRACGEHLVRSERRNLKELMTRIGHSGTRAAMTYQHASRDRDQAIAEALDTLIIEARKHAYQ